MKFNSMIGSQYIIQKLLEYNIQTIFGYTGGANLGFYNELYNNKNFSLYFNRHEQFSGFSAIGYTKSTQKIPLLLTTSGPGLTNVITPLQDAYNDGIPMFCISGQVSQHVLGTNAFQEVNAIELTKSCTKWNSQIKNTNELQYKLEEAFIQLYDKKTRYGPIHLDICCNVFQEMMEIKDNKFLKLENKKIMTNPKKLIIELSKKLNQSKRPILIIGKGNNAEFIKLRHLSKEYQIPVTTTLHAVGNINENDPLSLKMLGMHGTIYANKLVQESDLIIGIGNRFDDRTLGNPKTFGQSAKNNHGIYHINNNQACLNVSNQLIHSIPIFSNTRLFYSYIETNLKKKYRKEWMEKIKEYKRDKPLYYNQKELNMANIIETLNRKMNELKIKDFKITTGVGTHQMKTAQHFNWTLPNQLLTSGSLGTMGVGLCYAIGANIGNPKDMIINLDGDGSFMMSLQELGTIQQYNLSVKIMIMNNEDLNMISNWQELFYDKQYIGNKINNPKYEYIAKAYDIPYFKCDSIELLNSSIEYLFEHPSCIIEYKLKPEQCLPFVPPRKSLEEMIEY